jgi:hypothetical protein
VETLIRRCAGLDVHKASVVACVRVIDENGELLSFTQSFGTTAGDLLKLNDWLTSYAVTLVGMELRTVVLVIPGRFARVARFGRGAFRLGSGPASRLVRRARGPPRS